MKFHSSKMYASFSLFKENAVLGSLCLVRARVGECEHLRILLKLISHYIYTQQNMFTASTTIATAVFKLGGAVQKIQSQDNSTWQRPCGSKEACREESKGRGAAICERVSTMYYVASEAANGRS